MTLIATPVTLLSLSLPGFIRTRRLLRSPWRDPDTTRSQASGKSQRSKRSTMNGQSLEAKWKTGDRCKATYLGDGQVYSATIVGIDKTEENDEFATVEFLGYEGDHQTVWLSDLLPDEESPAAVVEGGLLGAQGPAVEPSLPPVKSERQSSPPETSAGLTETPSEKKELGNGHEACFSLGDFCLSPCQLHGPKAMGIVIESAPDHFVVKCVGEDCEFQMKASCMVSLDLPDESSKAYLVGKVTILEEVLVNLKEKVEDLDGLVQSLTKRMATLNLENRALRKKLRGIE